MIRKTLVLLGGVVLIAAAALMLPTTPSKAGRQSAPSIEAAQEGPFNTIGFGSPPRGQGPYVRGQKMTMAEAERRAPFDIVRPQHGRARDSSVRSVFFEAVSRDDGSQWVHVALDYDSGILIMLQRAEEGGFVGDLQARYESYIEGLAGAEVRTVHGVPAAVIQGGLVSGTRADGLNPSAVDLTFRGVRIQIYGQFDPSLTADDLVQVAESIE